MSQILSAEMLSRFALQRLHDNLAFITGINDHYMGKPAKAEPKPYLIPHPSACENCGSSDYQPHHGRLICSYCRTAPGPAAMASNGAGDGPLTRLDVRYGAALLRPEKLVRIGPDPRPCKGEV